MNIESLASAIAAILAPFTPFLVELGKVGRKKLVDVINKRGGEAAWNLAQRLWDKIKSYMGEDAEVKGAALMVSAKPEDESRQVMLAIALAAKLRENPKLAQEFANILGGQDAVQQIIANHKSIVTDVIQQMGGRGEQTIKADNNSRIKGVRQIQK